MRRLVPLFACATLTACGSTTVASTAVTSTATADAVSGTDTATPADGSSTDTTDGPNADVSDTTGPLGDASLGDTTAGDTSAEDTAAGGEDVTTDPAPKSLCVAIRGNGELITAHFAALARIVETFGPLDGVAGGSSASITSFFTESMHMHPGVTSCGAAPCSKLEAGARLGLMYKSLYGYVQAMTERDESVAIGVLLGVVEKAKADGIGALVDAGNLKDALDAIITLLSSDDVKDLVNPEILAMLIDAPEPLANVPRVWAAISTLGAFSADSTELFLRPGLVSFGGFAEKLGRIASFYAAYGPADLDAWEGFFDACALPGRGKPWPDVAVLDDGAGSTCGARFAKLLSDWRSDYIPAEKTEKSRLGDFVGDHMRVMVITSVFTGAAKDAWLAAHDAYSAGQPWTFTPAFSDVAFGYWGKSEFTGKVVSDVLGFGDLKTQKARALGQVPWRTAISMSPAEPGLSRALVIDADHISAGGWPDLAPVLALRSSGCDRVIYVTRRGPDSPFARGVASLAGMSADQDAALYDLASPDSSLSKSLAAAAGVWCTDWNKFTLTQVPDIMSDSWGAPFELHDPTLTPVAGDYPTATDSNLGITGCTPGVP